MPGRARDGELRLARVFGVPIVVTPAWWLGHVVVLLAYLPIARAVLPSASGGVLLALGASVALLLALSVLAHELGHCAVAARLGLPVLRVRLSLLGGVSELARSPARPRDDALVAAAGPAVSLVVAAAAAGAAIVVGDADDRDVAWLVATQLAVINIVVAAFNALPGLPLDGGRVLRAAVWTVSGRRGLGTRVAAVGGVVVAVAVLAWGCWSLVTDQPGGWLRFGVAVLTSWFVAAGALTEFAATRPRDHERHVDLAALVRPVLQLPAEIAVADALVAGAGRGVLLVRVDGVAAGLLDPSAAMSLARVSPLAPAGAVALPVTPDLVLFDSELRSTGDALDRVHAVEESQLLVVGEGGEPVGVLVRDDVRAALSGRAIGSGGPGGPGGPGHPDRGPGGEPSGGAVRDDRT